MAMPDPPRGPAHQVPDIAWLSFHRASGAYGTDASQRVSTVDFSSVARYRRKFTHSALFPNTLLLAGGSREAHRLNSRPQANRPVVIYTEQYYLSTACEVCEVAQTLIR